MAAVASLQMLTMRPCRTCFSVTYHIPAKLKYANQCESGWKDTPLVNEVCVNAATCAGILWKHPDVAQAEKTATRRRCRRVDEGRLNSRSSRVIRADFTSPSFDELVRRTVSQPYVPL